MSVASHRYGKTRVRVVRVVRSDDKHRVFDLSVQVRFARRRGEGSDCSPNDDGRDS
jgi:hypothetical protein